MIFSANKFFPGLFAIAGIPLSATENSGISSGEAPAEKVEAVELQTERFSTARSDFFEISAESAQISTRAAELAGEVETYFLKHPKLWKNLLPPLGFRVQVELFRQAGIFRLDKTENGRVRLFLSENFSTKSGVAEMRRHFVRAMIFHLAPVKNPENIPSWLVFAVAEESRLGSVPGRRIFLQKKSKQMSPVSPIKFLPATEKELNADETLRGNALWFLRTIPAVTPFFDIEKTDEDRLVSLFPLVFEDSEFNREAWDKFWATRSRQLIATAPSGVDLPEESQRVFDNALLVLVQKNGKETRILAGDLVEHRLLPEIRDTVSETLAALSAHFRKVNPVWHNAFAEYGLFLEMFGNPDVDNTMLNAQWDKAILARDDALAIQNDIRTALLSAPEEF